jgi:prepilin-type N-terminal cleavage/methylation domain-containing protein/prepilin-type processing-associated H-X9-DG protein
MGRGNPLRKAFTLIELLVVVAIIAVLVAILLPAIARARDQAKKITCQSQLRQQGAAMGMYVSEWHGFIPRAGYIRNSWYWSATNWDGVLFPYLGLNFNDRYSWWTNKTVFTCSADTVDRSSNGGWAPANDVKRSYLINDIPLLLDLQFSDSISCPVGKKADGIPNPSRLILLVCQPTLRAFICHDRWVCMSHDGLLGQIPGAGLPARYPFLQTHVGGTNFLYCDLHVDWQPWQKTTSIYFDGEPGSEMWWWISN